MTVETSPLPAEPEQLIVVAIVVDVADTSLVHLPAKRSTVDGRGGMELDRFDFPPAEWLSACREVRGSVYVRASVLANVPICPACSEAVGLG